MARTRKRSLWMMFETTYGTDPSATGSSYLSIPAENLSDITDQLEQLETDYSTGTLHDTTPIAGPDGVEISFAVPNIGFAAAGGDGGAPPATDWYDTIIRHLFGEEEARAGEGITSTTSTTIVTDATVANLGNNDMVAVHDAGVLGGRTQWARVTDAASAPLYTLTPAFAETPTSSAILYANKEFVFIDGGGASFSAVYQDDDVGTYHLGGGRVTSAVLGPTDAGRKPMLNLTVRFSTINTTAKASLPAVLEAPAITPVTLDLSPVWFNGAQIATASLQVDFGVEAARIPATSGAEGRAGDEMIRLNPVVTLVPLRTDATRLLKRNVTEGEMLIQLGAGVLAGGALNTLALNMGRMYASEVTPEDQDGVSRQSVTFRTVYPGATGRHFQLTRA